MLKAIVPISAVAAVLMANPLFGAGDVAKGKAVFEQCSMCHYADKTEKKMGPGLKGLFKMKKLVNGKPANEKNILEIINKGGKGMPAYKDLLTDKDRANLIAYLKTL